MTLEQTTEDAQIPKEATMKHFFEHPVKSLVRSTFEPGYLWRTTNRMLKEEKNLQPDRREVHIAAAATEVIKLVGYGYLAYKIAEHFLK